MADQKARQAAIKRACEIVRSGNPFTSRASAPVREPEAVLEALLAACAAYPDQRVGQVIVNALGADPFYYEDRIVARKLLAYSKGEVG